MNLKLNLQHSIKLIQYLKRQFQLLKSDKMKLPKRKSLETLKICLINILCYFTHFICVVCEVKLSRSMEFLMHLGFYLGGILSSMQYLKRRILSLFHNLLKGFIQPANSTKGILSPYAKMCEGLSTVVISSVSRQ